MSTRQFDRTASWEAAELAIGQVGDHADEEYMLTALATVYEVCLLVQRFTTDRIDWELDRVDAPVTHEPRAMGAVMVKAKAAGWCEPTSEYRPTVEVSAHRRPKRIWRSLLHDG